MHVARSPGLHETCATHGLEEVVPADAESKPALVDQLQKYIWGLVVEGITLSLSSSREYPKRSAVPTQRATSATPGTGMRAQRRIERSSGPVCLCENVLMLNV